MKRHIAFFFAALLGLSSCSALTEIGQSTGSQRFQDGVYAATSPAVRTSSHTAATRSDKDVAALTQKTRESKIYLNRGQADTLFVPEGKVAQYTFNHSDNSTVISVVDADDWWRYGTSWSLYPDWYTWGWGAPHFGFTWGAYRPWAAVGFYDPWYSNWYWDSWYWNRWDYGYWHYSWHNPWYDPWCGPWYHHGHYRHWYYGPGPHHHHHYGHHGWHQPRGRNGQPIVYTPRGGTMGGNGSVSGGRPGGYNDRPTASRRSSAPENQRGLGTLSSVRRSSGTSGVSRGPSSSGTRKESAVSGTSTTSRRSSGGSSSAVRPNSSSSHNSGSSSTYRRSGASSGNSSGSSYSRSSSSSNRSSSSYNSSSSSSRRSSSSSYSTGRSGSGYSGGGRSSGGSHSGGGRSSGGGRR